MLDAFLDRLPPITYDPSTVDFKTPTLPSLNISLVLTHKLALAAYIQLCNAVDIMSGAYEELYDRRLAIARRSMEISRAYQAAKIPIPELGIIAAVSSARFPVVYPLVSVY